MKFHIIKQGLTGTEIPKTVFENLIYARENDLKVILYLWQKQEINPVEISVQLNITLTSVNSSLLFWSDKGLLFHEEERVEAKKKRVSTLSAQEIIELEKCVPEVGILTRELQKAFGDTLNQKQITTFIELFIKENIPLDVILTICMYYITHGQNNPVYIKKVISSWYNKYNLTNGKKVEERIMLLEQRKVHYKKVAEIFNIDSEDINTSEKTLIDNWFEKYNMSEDMLKAAYLRAGNLAHIKYCDGIIKSWYKKGYKTTDDLLQEISNVQSADATIIPLEQDLTLKSFSFVPTFEKGE